jgi:hypothetical protein
VAESAPNEQPQYAALLKRRTNDLKRLCADNLEELASDLERLGRTDVDLDALRATSKLLDDI